MAALTATKSVYQTLIESVNLFWEAANKHHRPDIEYVSLKNGMRVSRKWTVKMVRFWFPAYKGYKDDQIFDVIYKNQKSDLKIKDLINKPVEGDEQMHQEFGDIRNLPQEKQLEAQEKWYEKYFGKEEEKKKEERGPVKPPAPEGEVPPVAVVPVVTTVTEFPKKEAEEKKYSPNLKPEEVEGLKEQIGIYKEEMAQAKASGKTDLADAYQIRVDEAEAKLYSKEKRAEAPKKPELPTVQATTSTTLVTQATPVISTTSTPIITTTETNVPVLGPAVKTDQTEVSGERVVLKNLPQQEVKIVEQGGKQGVIDNKGRFRPIMAGGTPTAIEERGILKEPTKEGLLKQNEGPSPYEIHIRDQMQAQQREEEKARARERLGNIEQREQREEVVEDRQEEEREDERQQQGYNRRVLERAQKAPEEPYTPRTLRTQATDFADRARSFEPGRAVTRVRSAPGSLTNKLGGLLKGRIPGFGIGGGAGGAGAAAGAEGVAAGGATGVAAATVEVWGPVVLVLFVVLIAMGGGVFLMQLVKTNSLCPPWQTDCVGNNSATGATGKLEIVKTGPEAVPNPNSEEGTINPGSAIKYDINVTYTGSGTANAKITDKVPEKTTLVEAPDAQNNGGTLSWDLTGLSSGQAKKLTFTVQPTDNDFWAQNQAQGTITGTSGGNLGGGSGNLLPDTLPNPAPNWNQIKATILATLNNNPASVEAYKKASEITGVPWELLAGLHSVETGGSLSSRNSLISGRAIGASEPDIPISACATGNTGPGVPIPIGRGCGFSSFLDSAIYAANHLAGKIGRVPQNFQDSVTALSRYNGGGNANCGEGVPYSKCPPDFSGEDDPYAMSQFDEQHANMFLIYCGDRQKCSPPRSFNMGGPRPGAMAVVRAISEGQ